MHKLKLNIRAFRFATLCNTVYLSAKQCLLISIFVGSFRSLTSKGSDFYVSSGILSGL